MSKSEPDSPNETRVEPETSSDQASGPQVPDQSAGGDRQVASESTHTEAGPPIVEETPEARIERISSELDEAKDRALRSQAELENYRKRVTRQLQEELRYANVPLIRDLLPVWDNMGRAIEAAENTHETASLLEGFKMVAEQLQGVLQRHHCKRIEALDQPFDPHQHEAICQQPCDWRPANTVMEVVQTGFLLHDRVVRPSQVIVSAAMPEAAGPATGDEEQEAAEEQTEQGGLEDG